MRPTTTRFAFCLAFLCLAAGPAGLFGQDPVDPPEGVPLGSDYLYRKHYAQVEEIMQLPLGQREKALESYYRKLHPDTRIRQYIPAFFGQIVKDYKSAGNAAEAKALEDKVLQLFPHLKPSPDQEVQAAFQKKDYDRAIQLGEELYAKQSSGKIASLVASSYIAKQNGAKAAEWSDRALDGLGAKEGSYYAAWLYEYYKGQQQIPKALSYIDKLAGAYGNQPPQGWKAAQWDQTRGEAEFLRAYHSYSQQSYKQAIQQFYKSLEYNGENEQAYTLIGLSHWKLKELEDAMGAFAVATVMNKPGSAKAREYLEQIYSARNGGKLDGLDKLLTEARQAVKP